MPTTTEKQRVYQNEYTKTHKEEIAAYNKRYNKTPKAIKARRIRRWKKQGIISDDYNSLYERFINTKNCENCEIELTENRYNTSTTRNLDHDHDITDRENVRNILCWSCNIKRG